MQKRSRDRVYDHSRRGWSEGDEGRLTVAREAEPFQPSWQRGGFRRVWGDGAKSGSGRLSAKLVKSLWP